MFCTLPLNQALANYSATFLFFFGPDPLTPSGCLAIICNLEACLWTVKTASFIYNPCLWSEEGKTTLVQGSNRKRVVRMCRRGNRC